MILEKEDLDLSGKIRITVYDNKLVYPGVYIRTGINRQTDWMTNKVVDSGKQSILDRLINRGNINEGVITYGAIGTDIAVAVAGDVALGTEIKRKLVTQNSRTLQTATIRTYYAPTEATGTISEFAWYGGGKNGDATGIKDSGTMYNKVLFPTPEVIVDTQGFTVEQDFSL